MQFISCDSGLRDHAVEAEHLSNISGKSGPLLFRNTVHQPRAVVKQHLEWIVEQVEELDPGIILRSDSSLIARSVGRCGERNLWWCCIVVSTSKMPYLPTLTRTEAMASSCCSSSNISERISRTLYCDSAHFCNRTSEWTSGPQVHYACQCVMSGWPSSTWLIN